MILQHILFDHDPWKLMLAVVICLIGAGPGTLFWRRALTDDDGMSRNWAFVAAVVLGVTVWTTHFVAMLAYHPSAWATFDAGTTTISVALSIIGLGLAILLSARLQGWGADAVGGMVLCLAVASMHYVGMAGMHLGDVGGMGHGWSEAALGLGALFGFSTVRLLRTTTSMLAIVAFTATVAGVHFMAMAHFDAEMAGMVTASEPVDHTAMALGLSVATLALIGTAVSGYLIQKSLANAADERLRSCARTDALTGLINRGGFNQALAARFQDRDRRAPDFALLFVDLDRFKAVNDGYGHPMGDRILNRVTTRLRTVLRDDDLISRLGGDEFAVIVATGDESGATAAAQRIVDVMARPFLIDRSVIEIGASVGIAMPNGQVDDGPARLIQNTDMALYAAKAAGRGTYRHFKPEIAEEFEARRQLEYDLRRAVVRNEFVLHFQPLISAEGGSVVGAEALLRWQHPTQGMIAPTVFIPLAEELGLVIQIGKWVIETATTTATTWPAQLSVSVNVSPVQLRDPRIVQIVREALDLSGLAPHRLEIEITETALVASETEAIETLSQLRELGVSLALDDFGTGFSSLSHLHKFPLDRIKIDRSFVDMVENNPKSARIVQAIGNLGSVLGLGVTAEGIETQGQRDIVSGQGCDVLQGYLFSKPISAEEFGQLASSVPSSQRARTAG